MADALIVIDMQNGLDIFYDQHNVIKNINELIKDYRNSSRPIIFVKNIDESMPKHSHEYQFFSDIDFDDQHDVVFDKTTPNSFYKTGLQAYLDDLNISSVEICGLQTDFCVDTTIKTAQYLGYDVFVQKGTFSTFSTSEINADKINQHYYNIWNKKFIK